MAAIVVAVFFGIVALHVYSKPHVEPSEWEARYVDYPTGQEVMMRPFSISRGPLRFFNAFFFGKQFLQDFIFLDAKFEISEKNPESSKKLDEKIHWTRKLSKDEGCTRIYLQRAIFGVQGRRDILLKATRGLSRAEIESNIEADPPEYSEEENFTHLVLRVHNKWNLDVVEYAVRFTIPTVNGVSVRVDKINGREEIVPISEKDFIIQIAIPLDRIAAHITEVVGKRKSYDATAYLRVLQPGTTRVTVQYDNTKARALAPAIASGR
jgi:hypothetical protein